MLRTLDAIMSPQVHATSAVAPFFEAHAAGGTHSRRLLLISIHFPPGAAAGALRWQKLSAFAHERGWTLDVITLHPDSLSKPDQRRLGELPPGTRVYGIPMKKRWLQKLEDGLWGVYRGLRPRKDTAAATESVAQDAPGADSSRNPGHRDVERDSITTWIRRRLHATLGHLKRAYYAWMDYHAHGGWSDKAYVLGQHLLRSTHYQAIVTCGPPHMVHDAGRRLSEQSGCPLVMDLRDPWRLVQRLADDFASPVWYWLARHYEKRVIARAALVVMNTKSAQSAMQKTYPDKRDQIVAIMNGYDEETFPQSKHRKKFTIAYAGTIYLDRDPRVLFRAVANVVRTLGLAPEDIGIELMGHIETLGGGSMQSIAAEDGIEAYVQVFAPGSRDDAMEFLSNAAILISLPQDSDMAIPSKIFEYMQFDAWLLALAQRGSATELLLRDSGADVVAPDDLQTMTLVITDRFRQYASGQRPVRLSSNRYFSRKEQARLLFDAIEGVLK